MTKQYATRLSLIAFATTVSRAIPPLGSGRDFTGTLQAALMAGLAFYFAGLIFGELGRRIADDAAHSDFRQAAASAREQA